MFKHRIGLSIIFLSFFIGPVLILSAAASGDSGDDIILSNGRVDPRKAENTETEIAFRVMVTSNQAPEKPIELVVETQSFQMVPVEQDDTNYTDGKYFQYKGKFSGGPKFYYFRCGNQTSRVRTFEVTDESMFESYHPDLIAAMALYMFPIAYLLYLSKKISGNTSELTDNLKSLLKNGSREKIEEKSGNDDVVKIKEKGGKEEFGDGGKVGLMEKIEEKSGNDDVVKIEEKGGNEEFGDGGKVGLMEKSEPSGKEGGI